MFSVMWIIAIQLDRGSAAFEKADADSTVHSQSNKNQVA
jgi:hypothetical protein